MDDGSCFWNTLSCFNNLGNFSTQGYITGRFLSINRSPSDFLGLNFDTSQGSNYKNMIYVLYATFTGYHRPFTEDNLFNRVKNLKRIF